MAATDIKPTMHVPTLLLLTAAAVCNGPACAENSISYQTFKYVESNQRIKVLAGDLAVEKDFGTDYTAHLDLGYDGISGATPCWKPASGYANEYVSGKCKVSDETRNAISGSLAVRDAARNEYTFGAALSHEPDFISREVSAQGQWWQDASHNRSYTLALGIQRNTSIATDYTNNHEDRSIGSYTLQGGVNQVVDANTTVEATLFAGRESGFLSHQYLTIVREDANGQKSLTPDSRPDTRTSGGVVVRWIHSWRDDLKTNVWLRHYRDSWGVQSNTLEAKAFWDIDDRWRLGPVVRLFEQGASRFYRAYGDSVNTFAPTGYGSNDVRVGKFNAVTAQLNVEFHPRHAWSVNAGLAHYRQNTGLTANWVTAGFNYRY